MEHRGTPSGARKQTCTSSTNRAATPQRAAAAAISSRKGKRPETASARVSPPKSPTRADQAVARLAGVRRLLGVTSMAKVAPVAIRATPKAVPCNTQATATQTTEVAYG